VRLPTLIYALFLILGLTTAALLAVWFEDPLPKNCVVVREMGSQVATTTNGARVVIPERLVFRCDDGKEYVR
jgi:hypothetical protein